MDIQELLTEYIDRCEEAIEKKEEIEEEYDLEAENTEPIERRYLRYAMDVNSMEIEEFENFLRDLSYPDLSLLLAVYKCVKGDYDFPDDVSSLRRTSMGKEILVRSIREKKPESMVSCLEDALEKVEGEEIDLEQ